MIARLIRWSVANRLLVLLATVMLTAWGVWGVRSTRGRSSICRMSRSSFALPIPAKHRR